MSYTENVASFLNSLDGFYENVPPEDLELLVGPIIEKMRSRPNSPLSGSPLGKKWGIIYLWGITLLTPENSKLYWCYQYSYPTRTCLSVFGKRVHKTVRQTKRAATAPYCLVAMST